MALGDYLEAKCHACIGGTSVQQDILSLKETGVHSVVGTPGRVFDLINRKCLGKSFNCIILSLRIIIIGLAHAIACHYRYKKCNARKPRRI